MRKMWSSVRWRLIIIYLIITVTAFSFVTVLVTGIIERELIDERVSQRIQEIMDISVSAAPGLSGRDAEALYSLARENGRALSGRVVITDKAGVVQIDSFSMLNGTQLLGREILEVLSGTKDSSYGFHKIRSADGGSFWAAYYTSAIIDNSQTIGVVLLSQSIQDVADSTSALRTRFIYVFLFTILGIIILSYLSTNHISRPIEELKEAATSIAGGKFSTRVKTSGNNEVTELGLAFNRMADQLGNVDKARSEFVSNASHELKTPLTSMKILAESLLYQTGIDEDTYKEFLSDINMEIDRLTNLINDLLMLTRLEDAERALHFSQNDITEMTGQVVKLLTPIAEQKGIELSIRCVGKAVCDCEPISLRQAINNLVDNAVKYTPSGGQVKVTVFEARGWAFVTVRDTGEGIPEKDIDNIFDRFYRVDKARSRGTGGNGLGLHIVKRIVNNHGGRISVKSAPGDGSRFTISIPVRQHQKPEEKEDA